MYASTQDYFANFIYFRNTLVTQLLQAEESGLYLEGTRCPISIGASHDRCACTRVFGTRA